MTHEQIVEIADRTRILVEGLTFSKMTADQLNNIYEHVYVVAPHNLSHEKGSRLRMEWIIKHARTN